MATSDFTRTPESRTPEASRTTDRATHGTAHQHAAAPLSDVRFLTVAEVAALIRVSRMTVYRLVHSGELTAVRVGRSFRVPEQAVHEYLRDAYIHAG